MGVFILVYTLEVPGYISEYDRNNQVYVVHQVPQSIYALRKETLEVFSWPCLVGLGFVIGARAFAPSCVFSPQCRHCSCFFARMLIFQCARVGWLLALLGRVVLIEFATATVRPLARARPGLSVHPMIAQLHPQAYPRDRVDQFLPVVSQCLPVVLLIHLRSMWVGGVAESTGGVVGAGRRAASRPMWAVSYHGVWGR